MTTNEMKNPAKNVYELTREQSGIDGAIRRAARSGDAAEIARLENRRVVLPPLIAAAREDASRAHIEELQSEWQTAKAKVPALTEAARLSEIEEAKAKAEYEAAVVRRKEAFGRVGSQELVIAQIAGFIADANRAAGRVVTPSSSPAQAIETASPVRYYSSGPFVTRR